MFLRFSAKLHLKCKRKSTDAIGIVNVRDLLHAQTLAFVQLLLRAQNAIVEELLQFLIGVINAELLEGVFSKELCKRVLWRKSCCHFELSVKFAA